MDLISIQFFKTIVLSYSEFLVRSVAMPLFPFLKGMLCTVLPVTPDWSGESMADFINLLK